MKKMFMKKIVLLSFICSFFFGCESERFNNFNPYIPNVRFDTTIDTNLPQYSELLFTGRSVFITTNNAGLNGVILFYTGTGFNAFEATCPNQPISSCSIMTVNNSEIATCPCDDEDYLLFTGEGLNGQEYPLKRYRTEVNGTLVRIYN
jgi:nitrite reductase/ring-hydroxylating ferredoxin subunit